MQPILNEGIFTGPIPLITLVSGLQQEILNFWESLEIKTIKINQLKLSLK